MATLNNQKEGKKICLLLEEGMMINNNIKGKQKEWALISSMLMEQL
jgi:hypothetical protein